MLRRGRPIMRTAMVVGTATAVSGSVAHRQQKKYAAQEAQAAPAAAPAAAAPVAAADEEHDDIAALTQLAQLHSQGILTDEEFTAKKAKILGI